MKIYWGAIPVYADKYLKILDVTKDVERVVRESGIKEGFVVVYSPKPTSAVAINENDPDLWEDMLEAYQRLVPIKAEYRHNAKYRGIPSEENAHAHILNTFIGTSVVIPVRNGKLQLGTWQSVLYIELDGFKRRELTVQVVGE